MMHMTRASQSASLMLINETCFSKQLAAHWETDDNPLYDLPSAKLTLIRTSVITDVGTNTAYGWKNFLGLKQPDLIRNAHSYGK